MGPDMVYTNGSQLDLTCSQVLIGTDTFGLLLAEKALSLSLTKTPSMK